MKVVIVGSGIGGLACAIACAQEGLDVTVFERTPELLPTGAGIQIPPNAARVARYLGTLPKLLEKGVVLEGIHFRRYANGKLLFERPNVEIDEKLYGAPWLVIHRADYQGVLHEAAIAAGSKLRLGAEADRIDFERTEVELRSGEVVRADIIIGADGLWSTVRDRMLGSPSPPIETGDLAYRGTFTKAQLEAIGDPQIMELCSKKLATAWLGPSKHAVFYPLKGGQQFNLVLLRPDDLPTGTRQIQGEVDEMRATFEGWDERLRKIISCLPGALKWKLCHHEELQTWVRGSVALLGDACHPTLPYQAQGAAMAVEDGAVLGRLLGLLSNSSNLGTKADRLVPEILQLYESLRKSRTTVNVKGAAANQHWYHLHDGQEQEMRDSELETTNWGEKTRWNMTDVDYQNDLLGFDVIKECEEAFETWKENRRDTEGIQNLAML